MWEKCVKEEENDFLAGTEESVSDVEVMRSRTDNPCVDISPFAQLLFAWEVGRTRQSITAVLKRNEGTYMHKHTQIYTYIYIYRHTHMRSVNRDTHPDLTCSPFHSLSLSFSPYLSFPSTPAWATASHIPPQCQRHRSP